MYEPPLPPVATLYVQDGEAYYRKLRFHQVAEALIEQNVIRPMRLVLVEPHSYRERPGGHNWATWEQGLGPGLKYFFGV